MREKEIGSAEEREKKREKKRHYWKTVKYNKNNKLQTISIETFSQLIYFGISINECAWKLISLSREIQWKLKCRSISRVCVYLTFLRALNAIWQLHLVNKKSTQSCTHTNTCRRQAKQARRIHAHINNITVPSSHDINSEQMFLNQMRIHALNRKSLALTCTQRTHRSPHTETHSDAKNTHNNDDNDNGDNISFSIHSIVFHARCVYNTL